MRSVTPPSSSRAGLVPRSLTTISSPAKAALATAAGAHHVINYRDEDAANAIEKLAPTASTSWSRSRSGPTRSSTSDVIKPRASIAIYANDGGSEFTLHVRQNMIKNVRYQFVLLYTVGGRGPGGGRGRHHTRPGRRSAARRRRRRPAAAPVPARRHGRCTPSRQDGAVGKVLIDMP